ncbi:hypothetical protein GBG21_01900 [Aeribacillus pallidus]
MTSSSRQELDKAFIRIEKQKEMFKKALMINEKLTNSLLNGCGLKGILNTLAVEMNCALLLENSHRQLIEASDSLRKIYLNSADYVWEKVETVDIT